MSEFPPTALLYDAFGSAGNHEQIETGVIPRSFKMLWTQSPIDTPKLLAYNSASPLEVLILSW